MKNISFFLSENFHFLVVNFSVYLNRRVFVKMDFNCWTNIVKELCSPNIYGK